MITKLTPEFLGQLSLGELADHLYNMVDIDPDGEMDDTKAIRAEIDRRGLTDEEIGKAWQELAAKADAEADEDDLPY